MYTLSYSEQVSLGMQVPDDDAGPDRCAGPAYGPRHGCGRFLAPRASMCDRCDAEASAALALDAQRQRAWDDEQAAREAAGWAAWEASPEGRASRAEEAARVAEADASGPAGASVEWLDDDLPF